MPQHELGERQYELKISSFTTTTLNLLFAEAERKGKTRNFRMYIGPGSDGSSADTLSLDLKFNPLDTARTCRLEWRSMSKTDFTPYDPLESWYTEQSDVWLDDVKTFHHRPMRCVIALHPYFLHRRTQHCWRNLLLSRAQKYALTTHVVLQTCTRTSA